MNILEQISHPYNKLGFENFSADIRAADIYSMIQLFAVIDAVADDNITMRLALQRVHDSAREAERQMCERYEADTAAIAASESIFDEAA